MPLTRRNLLVTGGAVSLTWPALTFPALAAPNFVAWHNRTTGNHKLETDKWALLGYRTSSLCIYGSASSPRYAAVMVKRPQVHAERQFFGISAASLQQHFNDMAAQSWGPYLITATGPANNPVMAISFKPMGYVPLTRFGITKEDFDSLNKEQYDNGGILRWVDAYGSASDPRYVAIWMRNTEDAEWNCDAINETGADIQARFNALTDARARPDLIALTPGGRYVESFTDSTIGAWISRGEMTSAGYQKEFNNVVGQGYYPHRVTAKGAGSATRFAAVFTKKETLTPRVFRSTGPRTDAGIDQAIETWMKAHHLRGAAFAVTAGSKLVYAKGYTWAEQSYPDTQPTTLFRLASVSKAFAATAFYALRDKAITHGGDIPLGRTLQSVLQLTQPDGTAPKDSQFGDIQIRHLLESTSGIPNGLLWHSVQAAAAHNQPLPATVDQLMRYVASFDLKNTPGDTTEVNYGNMGYCVLAAVLMKLTGATSFDAALRIAFMNALDITRVRISRSLAGAQPPDEAPYTIQRMPVGQSSKTDGRPLVASQYGVDDYEMFTGSGGLSGAVTDIARLVAMYSVDAGNPVMSRNRLRELLDNTVNASINYSGPSAHGYHGFDWATKNAASGFDYTASKGGWVPGSQSSISFTTGGLGFVIVLNGNGRKAFGVTTSWSPAQDAAKAIDWKDKSDLFPQFGMPSFSSGQLLKTLALSGQIVTQIARQPDAMEMTQRSMEKQRPKNEPQRIAPVQRQFAPVRRRTEPTERKN